MGVLALPNRAGGFDLTSNAHNLLFTTGEPAYAVDSKGCIIAWNKAAERAFGFDQSAAVGANCWELLQGRDVYDNQYCGPRCPHREMAARSRPINRCRMRFRLSSGDYADFLLSTLTFQESRGRQVLIHLCRPEPGHKQAEKRGGHHAPPGQLTGREQEVLCQLADGQSTENIATALGISIPTVRNHVEHILEKLDSHSRLEAVAVARKRGLIH